MAGLGICRRLVLNACQSAMHEAVEKPDVLPGDGAETVHDEVRAIGSLAQAVVDQERDLSRAAALREKVVAWVRRQAAAALALPEDAPLDDTQRNRIRTLAISTGPFGQILREQGSGDCVQAYEETVRNCQRIKDTATEAVAHYNLGRAYDEISGHPRSGRRRGRLPAQSGTA